MSQGIARHAIVSFLFVLFAMYTAPSVAADQATESGMRLDSGFVTVNGAKLWYEFEGEGEPLVFLPGGPAISHGYLQMFFSDLADSYKLVYYDPFGVGKSDRAKQQEEYTFDRAVEDLELLRQKLKLERISVLGHSYGGLVAQAYALKYPESVNKLVLANTLFNAEAWQALNENVKKEIENHFPEAWEQIQSLRAEGKVCSSPEHQVVFFMIPPSLIYFFNGSRMMELGPPDINPDMYFAMVGEDGDFEIGGSIAGLDFKDQLKDLKPPTLVLAGRYDRVCFPKYSVQFKKYAPQAQFVMFEQSGHFPFIEEPELVMDTLRKFLSQ